MLLTAAWVPEANTCVILGSNNKVLIATFTYSMCFDLLVFLLNAYKLGIKRKGSSRLAKMIFKDGLVFFFLAYVLDPRSCFIFLKLFTASSQT